MRKTFTLKIFKRGKTVWYNERPRIVDYVSIRGNSLWVHLEGEQSMIHESKIECEPTTFEVPLNDPS